VQRVKKARDDSYKVIKIGSSHSNTRELDVQKCLEKSPVENDSRFCVRTAEDFFTISHPSNVSPTPHLCLVYQPLGISLLDFIANQSTKGISLQEVKFFVFYLLHALDFLHSSGVVHTGSFTIVKLIAPYGCR